MVGVIAHTHIVPTYCSGGPRFAHQVGRRLRGLLSRWVTLGPPRPAVATHQLEDSHHILCTNHASPHHQGDVYSMTTAHHWKSGEQTIPMRYGRAIEELIRRSAERESPPHLAHATDDRSITIVNYMY